MVSKTDHPKVTFVSHKAGLTDHACPNKHISNCMVDHQVHDALTKTKLFNVKNVCNGIVCHRNSLHAAVSQVMDSDVEIHPVCISLCWRSKLKLDFYAQRYIQIKNQIKCLSSITREVVAPPPYLEAHVLSVSHKAGLTEHACPNKHISNCKVDHELHGALTKYKLFNVNNECSGILCHSNSFEEHSGSNWNLEMLVSEESGKPENRIRGKTSRSRERTNDKLSPHMVLAQNRTRATSVAN